MDFNFIDQSKFVITNYSYSDFDNIVNRYGYQQEKNGFLHNYFDWKYLQHWAFDYQIFNEKDLSNLFMKSVVVKESVSFLIRLQSYQPLIQINSIDLAAMLDDFCRETGMGWEAVSLNGKYIMEFTDNFEHKAKSNFVILS